MGKRGNRVRFRSYWFVLINDPSLIRVDSNTRQSHKESFIKRKLTVNKYNSDPKQFRKLIIDNFPELSEDREEPVFSLWHLRENLHTVVPLPTEVNNALSLVNCQQLKRSCVYIRPVEAPGDDASEDISSRGIRMLADASLSQLQPKIFKREDFNQTSSDQSLDGPLLVDLSTTGLAQRHLQATALHATAPNIGGLAVSRNVILPLFVEQLSNIDDFISGPGFMGVKLVATSVDASSAEQNNSWSSETRGIGAQAAFDKEWPSASTAVVAQADNTSWTIDLSNTVNHAAAATELAPAIEISTTANEDGEDDVSITTCFLCKQQFTDPRTLPCFDSFCLTCLENSFPQNAGANRITVASCPLCGCRFEVPFDGFKSLPLNSFLDKLGQLKKISNVSSNDKGCEVCKQIPTFFANVPIASCYCIACRQKLCDQCWKMHGVITSTRSHTVVPLGNESADHLLQQLTRVITMCSVHSDRTADQYCRSCRQGLCGDCEVLHNGHAIEALDDAADRCKNELEACLAELKRGIGEHRRSFQKLQQLKDDLSDVEKAVQEEADVLIQLVIAKREQLLNDLRGRYKLSDLLAESSVVDSVTVLQKTVRELLSGGSAMDLLEQTHNVTAAARGRLERSERFRSKVESLPKPVYKPSPKSSIIGDLIGEIVLPSELPL